MGITRSFRLMDCNAYIWLLLVIYRRHDKRDKRCPAIDTDESAGVYFTTLCRVTCLCEPPENSMIDENYRKKRYLFSQCEYKVECKIENHEGENDVDPTIFHFSSFSASSIRDASRVSPR